MVFEVNIAWLETVLRKYESEKNIAKVRSAKCEAAIAEGENYCSQLSRVKMEVILGSGRSAAKSIIIKEFPKSELQIQMIKEQCSFKNEIQMYADVFPLMEILMDENGDKSDKLWCDFYGYTPYTQLIMEDLQEKGFRMADRKTGLDLEHTLLVVRALGKFHAMSHALLANGRLSPNALKAPLLAQNNPLLNNFLRGGIEVLVNEIRTSWGSKWRTTANKLESLLESDTIGRRIGELYNSDNGFKVYIHGDCWSNNMLFKYNPNTDAPINIRLVDFQTCSYSNPAWDLNYFLFTSLQPGIRKGHFDEIINAYTDSLRLTLNSYNVTLENVPNADEVKNDINRFLLAGLLMSCVCVPVRMNQKPMDFEKSFGEDQETSSHHNLEMLRNEECVKFLQDDLEYFMSKGVI